MKIGKNPKYLWLLLKQIGHNYQRHNISRLAAESTYYLILSIVPFFIFFLNCLMFFAHSELDTVLKVLYMLPADSRNAIQPVIMNLIDSRSQTILSVGFLVAFWSASKGINALVRALDMILNVTGKEIHFIMVYVKSLVFTMTSVVAGFLSLFLWVFGKAVLRFVMEYYPLPQEIVSLWMTLSMLIPFVVIMGTLALFYRYAPTYIGVTRLSWPQALVSGSTGTILWILVTVLYDFYMAHIANASATYGPLVGLMVLFVWLNLSVQAVLIGAEVPVAAEEIKQGIVK